MNISDRYQNSEVQLQLIAMITAAYTSNGSDNMHIYLHNYHSYCSLPELIDDDAPMVEPHEDENTLKEELSRIKPWNSAHTSNIIQVSIALHFLKLIFACFGSVS